MYDTARYTLVFIVFENVTSRATKTCPTRAEGEVGCRHSVILWYCFYEYCVTGVKRTSIARIAVQEQYYCRRLNLWTFLQARCGLSRQLLYDVQGFRGGVESSDVFSGVVVDKKIKNIQKKEEKNNRKIRRKKNSENPRAAASVVPPSSLPDRRRNNNKRSWRLARSPPGWPLASLFRTGPA